MKSSFILAFIVTLVILFAAYLSSCAHVVPAPSNADGGAADVPATLYGQACANLKVLQCQEGMAEDCAEALQKLAQVARVDVQCLATVGLPGAVPACGAVSCTAATSSK